MSPEKDTLRQKILTLRARIPFAQKQEKSIRICEILAREIRSTFPKKSNILFFSPREKEHEPDIWPLFAELVSEYICFFPKITSFSRRAFEAFPARDKSEFTLFSERSQLLEPTSTKLKKPEAMDLVLVPAVVIDKRGNRIGHGQGFYDRYLPNTRPDCPKWAVVFSEQRVAKIPAEGHDVSVDAVVDEFSFSSFSPHAIHRCQSD